MARRIALGRQRPAQLHHNGKGIERLSQRARPTHHENRHNAQICPCPLAYFTASTVNTAAP